MKHLNNGAIVGLSFKGATKSFFTYYPCVLIFLFNTGLCRSGFSIISFGKLIFCVSVVSAFFVESTVLNQDIKICVIII